MEVGRKGGHPHDEEHKPPEKVSGSDTDTARTGSIRVRCPEQPRFSAIAPLIPVRDGGVHPMVLFRTETGAKSFSCSSLSPAAGGRTIGTRDDQRPSGGHQEARLRGGGYWAPQP